MGDIANITANLRAVRERVAAACDRAGRDPAGVTLVAVTKTAGVEETRELYRLGVRDFGENRVADGLERKDGLNAPDARWHLIGHLQRNKAAAALEGGYDPIHSVDSARLVAVLERECARLGRRAGVLLEANVSGEASKCGAAPEGLEALAGAVAAAEHVDLLGLMTMAPMTRDAETSRPVFRDLASWRKRLEDRFGFSLPHLSMGMTGDFEVAVEEGATLIRVGTALFTGV